LFRYGIVGLSLNGAGYLIYLGLTGAGLSPYVVVGVLYPVSVLASFLLNRRWSFNFKGDIKSSLTRFIAAHIGGYFLNLGLLYVFSGLVGFPHQAVQAVAIFVVAGYLFLLLKYIVYVEAASARSVEHDSG
jgi:putative flippase GtrA